MPSFSSVPSQRLDQDHNTARTLWYADGRSLNARVTRLDNDGIQFSTADTSGFIEAGELCTADRVRYGYGTRKESAWVERVNAIVGKHRSK